MTALDYFELASYVVTILGFPAAILVFIWEQPRERKYALFNIRVSIFERAFLLVYEDKMDRQKHRLWISREDYMRELCRRKDLREVPPELLHGEDEDFAANIPQIAEQQNSPGLP